MALDFQSGKWQSALIGREPEGTAFSSGEGNPQHAGLTLLGTAHFGRPGAPRTLRPTSPTAQWARHQKKLYPTATDVRTTGNSPMRTSGATKSRSVRCSLMPKPPERLIPYCLSQ